MALFGLRGLEVGRSQHPTPCTTTFTSHSKSPTWCCIARTCISIFDLSPFESKRHVAAELIVKVDRSRRDLEMTVKVILSRE